MPDDIFNFYEKLEREDEDKEDFQTVSVEINQEKIEILQKRYIYNKFISVATVYVSQIINRFSFTVFIKIFSSWGATIGKT